MGGGYAATKRHVLLTRGPPSSHLLQAEVVRRRTGVHQFVLMEKNENEDVVLDSLRSEVPPLRSIFRDDHLIRNKASDNPEFWIRPSGRALSEGALDRSRYLFT